MGIDAALLYFGLCGGVVLDGVVVDCGSVWLEVGVVVVSGHTNHSLLKDWNEI